MKSDTPSYPCHESIVPKNAQKQEGGKLSVLFCADGDTIETIFAQLFLSISSVSTEQSQICVRKTKLACKNRETRIGREI